MSFTHSPLSATSLSPEPIHPNGAASLGALLSDATLAFRDRTAFIEMDRARERSRWTFAAVRRRADALARRFELWGYGPGDRLAILMTNQPAWLITAFAAFLRGMVLVPLDWKLAPADQVALLRHANPSILLTESHIWPKLLAASEAAGPLPAGLRVLLTDWVGPLPEAVEGHPLARWEDDADGAPPTPVARHRDDLASIVYSSGTGGRPKGCQLTHDNYLFQLAGLMERFPTRPDDRFFSVLPTNHAIDFLSGFIGPMAHGAIVVHQRTLRPEFLLDTLRTQKITQMAVVPMLLEAFERALDQQIKGAAPWQKKALGALTGLNRLLTDREPNHALSKTLLRPIHQGFGGHLRHLFAGGAFVEARRARRFYDLGIPVIIGYGLTECTTVATVQDLHPFRADSVGRPVSGVEVRIVDPNAQGIGEVWIRGRTVMRGYLDEPELTAETLIPAEDGGLPWLRTGDLGTLDAAQHLRLVGRKKNMIVTAGGKNIYPEDLENAFAGVGAEDLAIFAEHFVWGPPEASDGSALTGERLVVVARGPDFPAIAKKIAAVNAKQPEARRVHALVQAPLPFPRTASMKVKREELAKLLANKVNRTQITPL